MGLIFLLFPSMAWTTPRTFPQPLDLHCSAFTRTEHLCLTLRARLLKQADTLSVEDRLAAARTWAQGKGVQQQGRRVSRQVAPMVRPGDRPGPLHADLGFARILAGHYGEGIYQLLAIVAEGPEQRSLRWSAADAAYIGVMLLWPELNQRQRQDWAADLAGRMAELLKSMGASSAYQYLQIAYLYLVSDEIDRAAYFIETGHKDFRHDQRFAIAKEYLHTLRKR